LAGGTHHAGYSHGAGYTILNDLALTAAAMSSVSKGRHVLIVDCDVHQGDGTASIVHERGLSSRVSCLSLHGADNYPHPKAISTWDVPLPTGTGDEAYMEALSNALRVSLEARIPWLVLYDAGVDIYEGDRLGRLDVTEEGIKRRDRHVIETCLDHGAHVACVIGGGYDVDRDALARRHAILHHTAAEIWKERRLWEHNSQTSTDSGD